MGETLFLVILSYNNGMKDISNVALIEAENKYEAKELYYKRNNKSSEIKSKLEVVNVDKKFSGVGKRHWQYYI